MSRIRKIKKSVKNYFVIDACVLSDKFVPQQTTDPQRLAQLKNIHAWWLEIDKLIKAKKARIYIPDICIAETFKTLAKEYYVKKSFSSNDYKKILSKFRNEIRTTTVELSKKDRHIKIHDLPTTRDIIISIDRFYRIFLKYGPEASTVDLMIIGSAKYLMDFYDIPKNQIHILTCDKALIAGCRKITEIPNAYDPRKSPPSKFFYD